jgi:hypothetical protein
MTYETNPTDLDALESADAALKTEARLLREQFEQDLKWMVGHKSGRRFVWWLMAEAGVFRNPWRAGVSEMAFAAGNMNIGQRLLAEVFAIAPGAFNEMLKESQEDGKRRKQR